MESFDAYTTDPHPSLAGFTKIEFSSFDNFTITDQNSNYDTINNLYIVPKSGYYQITTSFRLDDGGDAVSYGCGANTSVADNPYFLWSYSNPSRQGLLNVRTSYFNALDGILMLAFAESTTGFFRGSMSIVPFGS
jgi:hypothetical protein